MSKMMDLSVTHSDYYVAFGINLLNTTDLELSHVETYLHYGEFEATEGLEVKAKKSLAVVGKNTYGRPFGESFIFICGFES